MRKLNEDQLEISKTGPSFPGVTAEQLLQDRLLAERVWRKNPLRYEQIQQDYRYRVGIDKRPSNFYD